MRHFKKQKKMNDYFEILSKELNSKIIDLEILESDDEINNFDRGRLVAYRRIKYVLDDIRIANDLGISVEKLGEMKAS